MTEGNGARAGEFVAGIARKEFPEAVREGARFCIADWTGVALGAIGLPPVAALADVCAGWASAGPCPVLSGGRMAAAPAALVNGTLAHTLDFDDTHVGSIAHLSGPTWAAAWAAAAEVGADPAAAVRGFVAGFEIGARLGGGGFGVATNERHTHATGVFGCLGAAAAAASVYGLDAAGVQAALGLAATQVGGLTASFGTPAKPFHAGKAAFNGVLAAQMARRGYPAALDLLEPGGGLDRALVQDGSVRVQPLDFDEGWEITRNTFKPYASCLLTHPVIDAGRSLVSTVDPASIETIRVMVHPLAIQLAGKTAPTTPYEGKFSLAYTVALALAGRTATQGDFTDDNVGDPALQALVRKVELVPTEGMALTAAALQVLEKTGRTHDVEVPLALGNPGRPMTWSDMRAKFLSLAAPKLGEERAERLFDGLRRIETARWSDLEGLLTLPGHASGVRP